MRIGSGSSVYIWRGSGFLFDADQGYQNDADPEHCSIPEVRISDRPGDRKWRLATLFNTGSAYFRSSWSPEVKSRNTVQYRKCVFQIVLESGSEDSQPGLILSSGEINWTLNTVQYRKCAYFRLFWSPEVKTRSLAWFCPPGRSTGTVPAWAAWLSVPAEWISG
jgi:hypothetical protein